MYPDETMISLSIGHYNELLVFHVDSISHMS